MNFATNAAFDCVRQADEIDRDSAHSRLKLSEFQREIL